MLKTILTIGEFVLAFGVLVFLHELGHFIMARINKIEVEEFGFGYPPRMVKLFTHKGTIYSLNWIPFGGFTKMKGETGNTMEAGSFAAANPWRRLTVLLGGPFMNLLVGMLLIAVIFTRTGTPDYSKVQIQSVAPNSPAALAGIKPLDTFVSIDGIQITGMTQLSQVVKASVGKEVEVTVLSDGNTQSVTLTPRANPPQGEGALGVVIGNPVISTTILGAIPYAVTDTLAQGKQLILLPYQLIKGQISPEQGRVVSVVGIYDIFSQVQSQDQAQAAANPQYANLNTLYFFAVISIALGYTNLLPIPALDGGHILFLLPELLFKKKVKPEFENAVHFIGFALLMVLMVVLVVNDVVNPIVLP